jgi:hypothetical protein
LALKNKNKSMKRNIICAALLLAGLPFLNSCKDDEPKPAGITFETTDEEILESDATIKSFHPVIWQSLSGSTTGATGREIKIRIVSDKPLADNVIIPFTLDGTATKNSSSAPVGDFEITSNTVTMEKGASEAFITFTVFEDLELEDGDAETVIFTLGSISGAGKVGTQNVHTVKILEDDAIVDLKWSAASSDSVDMDLFLWLGSNILDASQAVGSAPETVSIPAGLPNGTYGMGYTYYSGKLNALTFTVDITNLGGKLNNGTSPLKFTGNYTLNQINRYDADLPTEKGHQFYKGQPVIVQTMVKNGFNYQNVSGITPAADRSRIADVNPDDASQSNQNFATLRGKGLQLLNKK